MINYALYLLSMYCIIFIFIYTANFESDNERGWRDDELLPDLAVDEGGCVIQVMTRPWKSSDKVHSRLGMDGCAYLPLTRQKSSK